MTEKKKKIIEWLQELSNYGLVLGAVISISFLFPDSARFKYHFEQDKLWRYEDLRAPFAFAILKAAEEVRREEALLMEDFLPYYLNDPSIAKAKAAEFEEAFERQLQSAEADREFKKVTSSPEVYKNYGLGFLARRYQRGILALEGEAEGQPASTAINVIRGNTAYREPVSKFSTQEEVKAMLSDSLPYSRLAEPEFLYPLLEAAIVPNIAFSDSLTAKFKAERLSEVSLTHGMVQKDELIVQRNSTVTEPVYRQLQSLKAQYEAQSGSNRSHLWIYLGYFLLVALMGVVLLMYLRLHAVRIYARFTKMLFLYMWLVIYSYLVYAIESVDSLSVYLIPFCIVPIVVSTFFNVRVALFTHLMVVLVAGLLSTQGYDFVLMQLLAGMVVLVSGIDIRSWSRFFYAIGYVFISYALSFFCLNLIDKGDIAAIDWPVYSWILLNVFFTLLAYPLIPLLERLFGFTSPLTLVELSNMNHPLLRDMAIRAPGTLQHSLQVANMAEAAANRIGADPLLVRVAALYHDIGKVAHPMFFIENQSEGNPHDNLSELESAKIIIAHVTEGVQMARKANLPPLLINFIQTHHGTTRVEYFYRNYKKKHPEEEIDEALFRYPGPRPTTKEETILMLADSIEAATKSLKSPTKADLTNLIDNIVSHKLSNGQLDASEMNFRELEECRLVFKKVIKSVHHARIVYPDA